MKTKYRLGFSFYHNHELHKVVGIYINNKAQVFYKCYTFDECFIVLSEYKLNQIIAGKVNGQKPDVYSG